MSEEVSQGGSNVMRETIMHPGSCRTQTPHHNPGAEVGFAQQPTGRFDLPKPPATGVYAVPGPGAYSNLRTTRKCADLLTNSAKPTFGKEEQRPDLDGMASRSPGPVYDTLDAYALGKHAPPKFSMSPRVWASDISRPKMQEYEPPLGKLPDSMGRQVQGQRVSAPNAKFPKSQQRPTEIGGGGARQYMGKDLQFAFRGAASVHVPNYVSHATNGLYRSTKQSNSPRFGFARESRF